MTLLCPREVATFPISVHEANLMIDESSLSIFLFHEELPPALALGLATNKKESIS
jgi:hypothetical protein